MNTKTSLIILGVAVVVIAIIALTSSKKDDTNNEPQIDPVTGEVILGTGGPDDEMNGVESGDSENVNAPANPTFPKTGFKPVK